MTDYQELYELARRRADMCEGQILELRRRVAALEGEVQQKEYNYRSVKERLIEEIEKRKAVQRENRRLRATTPPAPPEETTP